MDYLAACPFCKSIPIGVSYLEDGLYLNDPERKHPGRFRGYAATCDNCGARGPVVKVSVEEKAECGYLAVEHAAELWNEGVSRKVSN